MDGLRPEVDELDRFNKRSASTPSKNSASSHASANALPAKSSGGSLMFLVLLIICVSSGFAWFSWQQYSEINALKNRLSDASGFMDQSKLLIARLEGRLSETGVELAETGTAAEKKLAFLDSEMRKLWGVAYDKNRKTIEENQKQVDRLTTKLSTIESKHSEVLKALEVALSDTTKDLQRINKSLDARMGTVANELSILRADQGETIERVEKRLEDHDASLSKIEKNSQSYLKQSAKLDLSIESINASRRQLNERVVELERRLNALQLKISPPVN